MMVLSSFHRQRALLEMAVKQSPEMKNLPPELIETAVSHLSDAIEAALKLGKIDLADTEAAWGKNLVINYGFPIQWQAAFYDVYAQAVSKYIADENQIITGWLNKVRKQHVTKN